MKLWYVFAINLRIVVGTVAPGFIEMLDKSKGGKYKWKFWQL